MLLTLCLFTTALTTALTTAQNTSLTTVMPPLPLTLVTLVTICPHTAMPMFILPPCMAPLFTTEMLPNTV
jgi:hypothetical protein